MLTLPLIGNDVVDLHLASEKVNQRFIQRVFTDDEQYLIKQTSASMLWRLWSAKETAYKIISKINPDTIFSHRLFATEITSVNQQQLTLNYQDKSITMKTMAKQNALHTLAVYPQGQIWQHHYRQINDAELKYWQNQENLQQAFKPQELASIHHPPSAIARVDIKNVLEKHLQIEPSVITIIRPKIANKSQAPYLLINQQTCEFDISISHHGEWVAWGIARK